MNICISPELEKELKELGYSTFIYEIQSEEEKRT